MRAAVRNAFVAYSTPLEGALPFLYLDQLGLLKWDRASRKWELTEDGMRQAFEESESA